MTKSGANPQTYEVATLARTTESMVKSFLSRTLEREFDEEIRLQPDERFRLAFLAAASAGLTETARTLDWREFERFAEECLARAGYKTERNLRLTDGKKRWEIDVVASKSSMTLFLDCKHWQHNSPQRLRKAVEHQKKTMKSFVKLRFQQLDAPHEVWALPVILTLFENNETTVDGGVLVSVQKFSDLLAHLTPYDPQMPFVHSTGRQKPIK